MTRYEEALQALKQKPGRWLVTGAAGFIGSHLLETLLLADQTVTGFDNLMTGHRRNCEEVLAVVGPERAARFHFIEGDIRDLKACRQACAGADYVLHEAAVGSVPRSILDPLATHEVNVNGFLNILMAARDQGVKRLVYASSSSVYGDDPGLPKVEDRLGRPLSPYAATKRMDEVYAAVFSGCYGLESIGLRYFNVFGPRQDPDGPYAAVIPKWVAALKENTPAQINGDGSTSRDFCYVANVVQANLLAAAAKLDPPVNEVFNIALNARTTLNELFEIIRRGLMKSHPQPANGRPVHGAFRSGDIQHSQADISKAARLLGYAPTHSVEQGMQETLAWYEARN